MYIFVLLYFIFDPLKSEFSSFPVISIKVIRILFGLNYSLITIFGICKSVIGIIVFFKYYKYDEIKLESKKLLLTIPYIIISAYVLIVIISHHIKWGNRIYEIIIIIFVFVGNIFWEYYWIYVYTKKNISKEFMYIYCGLFPFFLYSVFMFFI
jgi:hypothetical protein